MLQDVIREELDSISKKLNLTAKDFSISRPPENSLGDFCTNIAFRVDGEDPSFVAKNIVEKLEKCRYIKSVSIDGGGFINIFLKDAYICNYANALLAKGGLKKVDILKRKKMFVEYTDPNIFKPLHLGHLMNNSIGESLSRILSFAGAKIIRICYPSDIGPHVAKTIYIAEKIQVESIEDLGRAYADGVSIYESNTDARAEIDKINKVLYESPKGNSPLHILYKRLKKMSLDHFDEFYKKVGTKFDKFFFESETGIEGKKIVLSSTIFEKDDGAVVYKGSDHTRVFITSESNPTYEAKEVGLAFLKENLGEYDRSYIITSQEQKEYFKVVYDAIGHIREWIKEKTIHIGHGEVRFPDGKMSSRSGNVITALSFIDSVSKSVLDRSSKKISKANAEIIALGAIKFSMLEKATQKNITFDENKAIQFNGNTGPYIQYSCIRARSIINKAGFCFGGKVFFNRELILSICALEDAVVNAVNANSPHYIAHQALQIASVFNEWYAKEQVLGAVDKKDRLKLVSLTEKTLQTALDLLGIKVPSEM